MARKFSLTREEQAAAYLYPHLASDESRKEMASVARNDRKKPPSEPALLKDSERGAVSKLGGVAKK
jgi:hypothetical protein